MSRKVNVLTRGTGQVGALLIGTTAPVLYFTGAGAPTDGTTGAGDANLGSVYTNRTTGAQYVNVGTKAAPVWVPAGGGSVSDAIEVWNATGGALAAGDLVYTSGWDATSNLPKVTKADADAGAGTAAQYVVREAIADGASGLCGTTYELGALNTNTGNVGDPVYLSATAGGWTLSIPSGTAHLQIVGRIKVKSASVGVVDFIVQPPITGFLKQATVVGGAAGDLTLTGVDVGDRLVSVLRLDRDATAANVNLSTLTAEFTITATNTINNAAGTNTTGDTLIVTYVDRT